MLRNQIEQYLEVLECECKGFETSEKRYVAAILESYIDDLKEILTREQTQ